MRDSPIRIAGASDLGVIRAIYNHYVAHSTCTFQIEPETAEQRAAWFSAHGGRHPVTVFQTDGEVLGWASLSAWNSRCAYRQTAEISVYVDHRHVGNGIGTQLVRDLIGRARQLDFHVLLGGICSEQEASLRLHRAMGFVEVARFREVGRKFDRWLDVIFVQRTLAGAEGKH